MLTLDKITIIVSDVRNMDVEIIMSRTQKGIIADSRHLIAKIALEQGYREQDVADYFGRDRSTIYHCKERAEDLICTDRNYRVDYETIKELIDAERLSN